MQNFTKEESSALLYLKLARDLGAKNVNFDKSTCEVIINLVERLMKEKESILVDFCDELKEKTIQSVERADNMGCDFYEDFVFEDIDNLLKQRGINNDKSQD